MDDVEEWREIPSRPTHVASSWGRVMVKPYASRTPTGGDRSYGGVPRYGSCVESDKRPLVVYKGKTYRVSRLVCEAFHGPPPFPRAVAMHLDDDTTNNRPENLRWGTQKENLNAPGFIARCRARAGDRNPYAIGKARRAAAQ